MLQLTVNVIHKINFYIYKMTDTQTVFFLYRLISVFPIQSALPCSFMLSFGIYPVILKF